MTAVTARGCRVVGGRPMAELQIEAQLDFLGEPPPLESSRADPGRLARRDSMA